MNVWRRVRRWLTGRRLRRQTSAIEQVTARNVARLVPKQRPGSDPVWWEFLRQWDGGDDRDR